ncbi:MAG: hypothetical protein P1V51_02805 [Deltaproteobacteria bacterium]|nr:hypothetical protein [Deltaproteobacteria bacterium]
MKQILGPLLRSKGWSWVWNKLRQESGAEGLLRALGVASEALAGADLVDVGAPFDGPTDRRGEVESIFAEQQLLGAEAEVCRRVSRSVQKKTARVDGLRESELEAERLAATAEAMGASGEIEVVQEGAGGRVLAALRVAAEAYSRAKQASIRRASVAEVAGNELEDSGETVGRLLRGDFDPLGFSATCETGWRPPGEPESPRSAAAEPYEYLCEICERLAPPDRKAILRHRLQRLDGREVIVCVHQEELILRLLSERLGSDGRK